MTQQYPPPSYSPPPPQWQPQPAPAAAQTPPKKRKKWPWIVGAVVLLFVIIGVSNGRSNTVPTTPTSLPVTPGQAFVKDIKSYPGLTTDMSDADLVGIAGKVCDAIGTPGITYDNLVAGIATSKLGPQVAPILVNAANRSYCPGKQYYVGSVAAYTPPAAAPTPAAATAGPLATFSDGTYEVGDGDGQVAPGKYRAPGGGGGMGCYYARLKNNDGSLDDIIDSGYSHGQTLLTVKKTDGYVEVSDCTFTKS